MHTCPAAHDIQTYPSRLICRHQDSHKTHSHHTTLLRFLLALLFLVSNSQEARHLEFFKPFWNAFIKFCGVLKLLLIDLPSIFSRNSSIKNFTATKELDKISNSSQIPKLYINKSIQTWIYFNYI